MKMTLPAEQNVGTAERLISGIGGGLLAISGLRRGPIGLPLALLGVALVARSIAGRCPVYNALGISSVEKPHMQEHAYEHEHRERIIDETVEQSFPASDPPGGVGHNSFTQVSE